MSTQDIRARIDRMLAATPQDPTERPWWALDVPPLTVGAAIAELADAREAMEILRRDANSPQWETRATAATAMPTVQARISRARVVIRLLAPILQDQRGTRWTPTGQVRGAEPLYVLAGVTLDAPRLAQSTIAELTAAGLQLVEAGAWLEQQHLLNDPAVPSEGAAHPLRPGSAVAA